MGLFIKFKKVFKKKHLEHPLLETLESLHISVEELRAIKGIKDTVQTKVKDIMTPRADIEWVDMDKLDSSLKSVLVKTDHSYLVLSKGNLDKVVGKLCVKAALGAMIEEKNISLEKHTSAVLYISPSLSVLDLIMKMKKAKNFLALVVDEFGGIDGLVTFHDIVQDVLGEIEIAPSRLSSPAPNKNHVLVLDGRYDIEEFEEKYGKILTDQEKENDIETLAGLISSLAGRVPKKGELISHPSGVRFEILECNPRKIIKVKIHNMDKLSV